jgi:hypothetical protein
MVQVSDAAFDLHLRERGVLMRIAVLREVARAKRRQSSVFVPVVALVLAAPSVAHAAQGFVGVTNRGQVVRLSDQTLPGVSTPVRLSGLRSLDSLVAVDRAPSGALLALGRSSAIYTLDAVRGRVRQTLPPFTAAIHGEGPLTFTVAAGGSTRDRSGRRRGGGSRDGCGVAGGPADVRAGRLARRTAGGARHRHAAGRATGRVRRRGGQLVVQRAAGGPLSTSTALPGGFGEPTRITVAPDASAWLSARRPTGESQSRLVRYDSATGRVGDADGPYLVRDLVALAAVGPVPNDTRAPSARISVPPRESLRTLRTLRFDPSTGRAIAAWNSLGRVRGAVRPRPSRPARVGADAAEPERRRP